MEKNTILSVLSKLGDFIGFEDGKLIFKGDKLSEDDMKSIGHIRINTMTGRVFDDRDFGSGEGSDNYADS